MSKLVNYPFTGGGLHGDVSCNLSTLTRVGGGRLNERKSNERCRTTSSIRILRYWYFKQNRKLYVSPSSKQRFDSQSNILENRRCGQRRFNILSRQQLARICVSQLWFNQFRGQFCYKLEKHNRPFQWNNFNLYRSRLNLRNEVIA